MGHSAGGPIAVDLAARAVAYDRPPFGLSGRPLSWDSAAEDTNPYTLAGATEFARRLIERLGLGKVVVMGHSAGGPIAVDLAARHPELVAGVVLIAPAISTNSKGFLAQADLGQLIRQQIYKRAEEVRQGKLGVYYDDTSFARDEQWANQLASSCTFSIGKADGQGENLALGYAAWADTIFAWYNQQGGYNYSAPGFSQQSGGFTQMVSADCLAPATL
ncbi:AB hydrolase-1 domain-containing protein, partial [Haematococcus lacustris]